MAQHTEQPGFEGAEGILGVSTPFLQVNGVKPISLMVKTSCSVEGSGME